MSLTLAITAYRETTRNNCDWLQECIEPAVTCEAVDEILVVDDGSEDWCDTADMLAGFHSPKLNFYHFGQNQCVFGSKIASVCHAHGDWVQLCDSDNVMDKEYLERVARLTAHADCNSWFSASFAKPVFDYRHFAEKEAYDIHMLARLVGQPRFDCLMNTGNQCVNRTIFDNAFRVYLAKPAHVMFPNWLKVEDPFDEGYRQAFNALDSFLLNLVWLTKGGKIYVVPELEYRHRVTNKKQDSNYNRAPDLKDKFGRFLLTELQRRAK